MFILSSPHFNISSGQGSDGIVCAGTGCRPLKSGLHKEHAYSVLGVLEVERERLLKIRNPWGKGEWTGPWSKKWIRDKRKEWSELETGPGEFFMRLQDFQTNFRTLTICHILGPDWREKQRRSEITPSRRRVEFTLNLAEAKAETMIAFSQIGRRQLRDEIGTQETLLNIRLSVFSENTNVASQDFQQLRTKTFRRELKAGTYKILAEAKQVDRVTGVFLRVASTCKTFNLS